MRQWPTDNLHFSSCRCTIKQSGLTKQNCTNCVASVSLRITVVRCQVVFQNFVVQRQLHLVTEKVNTLKRPVRRGFEVTHDNELPAGEPSQFHNARRGILNGRDNNAVSVFICRTCNTAGVIQQV